MAKLRRSSKPLAFTAVLTVLAIAAGGAVVLTPTTADARPVGIYTAFYSDASHSVQVGYVQHDCDHNYVSSGGEVTDFWTVESAGCDPQV